ncbi:MAG: prephenate dehydrogenase/arogenate dehydrogenase family protein [Planctomycetota bacterium]|nr:prephenate dehydrogenase/arogenate dehydrogenase family protein [Planctomycetota bacterium]
MDRHLSDLRGIAIVGTGLLGGSIGLGLKAAGFAGKRIGVGRRIETPRRALELGCVDEATTDLLAAAGQCDLVILATPLRHFAGLLTTLAGVATSSAASAKNPIITDVGSTKQQVCADALRILPAHLRNRFIGAHPMAGSEHHGPDNARADLCAGRPCILTPMPDADPGALAVVEALWRTLRMRLVRMAPREHDHAVARISHLPHALAATLVGAAEQSGSLDIASSGFASTTRVASGDPEVWVDIFRSNREEVVGAIDEYMAALTRFRELVATDRELDLAAFLRQSQAGRDRWLQSHRPPAEPH